MPYSVTPVSRHLLISCSLFCFAPLTAYANDAADSINEMPTVVVSATRVPTPYQQLASSVTVITADDIDTRQERTLPDVLQNVPGLNIVQNGGPGGLAQVFMRGTNANHTKVMIDGIDVSDPSSIDGSFDFSQILSSDIKQVEVLRGPQSGLYGSDAIGGVINIITKSGSGPAHLTGSVEGGSFETFNQTAGVSGGLERFNYSLNAAHFYSGATPSVPDALVVPGRPQNDDQYDNQTLSTKLGARLTDNFDIGFTGRYIFSVLDNTSDDLTGPEAMTSSNTNHEAFTRGTAHLVSFDGRLDQTAGLAYTRYTRDIVDPNAGAFSPFTEFGGNRIKADWQGNIKATETQTVTLGAEHQLDRLDEPQASAHMSNNAGFVQLQSAFNEQFFNTVSLRDDDNSRFGSRVTYRVAPAYLLTQTGTKLKASVGTGYKAPTLDELFDDYPAFGFFANPNLQPERSFGYDAGFEQTVLNKKVQFGSTYFHNDIRNLIAPNDTFTTDINVGRASTYGFESFIAYKPWKKLNLRADHTFTIAENDLTHTQLLRRPKNKASIEATWQATDAFTLSSSVLYNGTWRDDNRNATIIGLAAGGYTVVRLMGAYDLGNGVALFGRIDNALDKEYQDPVGFQRPGFGIFGGIKIAMDIGKDSK